MSVCYIVGVLIMNSWERVCHDVFKNFDLNYKKYIQEMKCDSKCWV